MEPFFLGFIVHRERKKANQIDFCVSITESLSGSSVVFISLSLFFIPVACWEHRETGVSIQCNCIVPTSIVYRFQQYNNDDHCEIKKSDGARENGIGEEKKK